jgi:methanogenic corrinoid protein MtbC1
MPAEQIAQAAVMFHADLVVLTATLATQLTEAAQAVAMIRKSSGSVKILVGGAAFEDAPSAWQTIGADGFSSDLEGAVAAGHALVQS